MFSNIKHTVGGPARVNPPDLPLSPRLRRSPQESLSSPAAAGAAPDLPFSPLPDTAGWCTMPRGHPHPRRPVHHNWREHSLTINQFAPLTLYSQTVDLA